MFKFLFYLCFGLFFIHQSTCFAMGDSENDSSSKMSGGYMASIEYKPVPSLIYMKPGGAGGGVEVEIGLNPQLVVIGNYLMMISNPSDKEYEEIKEDDNLDENDYSVRSYTDTETNSGFRWYQMRKHSSWYIGTSVGIHRIQKDFIYLEENISIETREFRSAIEVGYRWMMGPIVWRLGINGGVITGRRTKITESEGDTQVTRDTKKKFQKEDEDKDLGLTGGIDIGIGMTF